jgi:hypothetical protein
MQRALIVIVACALVAVLGAHVRAARSSVGDVPEISAAQRAATFSFDGVTPQDRAWIEASIAAARPEAQQLIAEVDGLVDFRTDFNQPGSTLPGAEGAIGVTDFSGGRAEIGLDVRLLDGERAIDRPMVVLHELGHVIDFLLVDDALLVQLDAGIPPAGPCQSALADYRACTPIEERFADTFAKWALRGSFSLAGSGYGIPTPPSLEDWGQPLARLSYEPDIKARD